LVQKKRGKGEVRGKRKKKGEGLRAPSPACGEGRSLIYSNNFKKREGVILRRGKGKDLPFYLAVKGKGGKKETYTKKRKNTEKKEGRITLLRARGKERREGVFICRGKGGKAL